MGDIAKAILEGDRARLLVETLVTRYPDRFTPEDVEALTEQINQILATAARLRAYPLTNADEPDPIFRVAGWEG